MNEAVEPGTSATGAKSVFIPRPRKPRPVIRPCVRAVSIESRAHAVEQGRGGCGPIHAYDELLPHHLRERRRGDGGRAGRRSRQRETAQDESATNDFDHALDRPARTYPRRPASVTTR